MSVWPHFERPETRNWSITICAPLTKSPNCASQSTSASRRGDRVAVLEADAGELRERRVVDLERGLRAVAGAASARSARPCCASCRTTWRCENVPRSVSWPVIRIGMPSHERGSRTRAPRPGPSRSRPRRARRGGAGAASRSFGCTVKPSGTRSSSSFSSRSVGRRPRSRRRSPSYAVRSSSAAATRRAAGASPSAARAPRAAGR